MKTSLIKNVKNAISFKNEKKMYRVKPIIQSTLYWTRKSHVSNVKKAKKIYFSKLNGMKLYAKFVIIESETYWKMYIKDGRNISIIYVPTYTLNPIGLHKK